MNRNLAQSCSNKLIWYLLYSKVCLPSMRMNSFGRIVLMGSDQSLVGKAESSAYGITKAAILQLTKSTAIDYAPHDITVNCVCPGTIDTPLYHGAVKKYADDNNINPDDVYEGLKVHNLFLE